MAILKDMNRFEFAPTNLDISRSVFNRNHSFKGSFNVGDVIPFMVEEVLPGDTFTVDTNMVVRLQPLVTPIMDEVVLDKMYFFCPNRLAWNHWKEFCGENTSSPWTPQVEYSVPQIEVPTGGFNVGTIADYMGIPPKAGVGKKFSALPFRAYARICDEWFRDQNNMNPVNYNLDDSDITGSNGSDQVTDIQKGGSPFVACKLHDYFTSCLPSAQKGQAVTLPLGNLAPVVTSDDDIYSVGDTTNGYMKFARMDSSFKVVAGTESNALGITDVGRPATYVKPSSFGSVANYITPNNLYADLQNATASTVNQLRQAFAIQKYYEKLARGGSRYTEFVKAFFGVTSPDSRIQRTEYLGGNRITLNVNQVEQTSATESGITPQGNVVGMSVTGDIHSDFTKSFTEHGFIIGVCVARYHHCYQQGLERFWSRKKIFDFYNPVFANLGEQAVYTKEIFFDVADDDDVFGFQEAWADLRSKPSRIAGQMRSVYSTSLDMWHLADDYASAPQLGDAWIREDKTNLDRCLAVTSSVSNQLIADFYIQSNVARPLPLYSIPGLIDHH